MIVPFAPALNVDVALAAVVVMIPVWLIEPPADVTSSRLALVVGSTTLPAVALNSAGPDVETLPLPVEVTEVPVKETLLPETGPPIVIVPVVVKFMTEPAINAVLHSKDYPSRLLITVR